MDRPGLLLRLLARIDELADEHAKYIAAFPGKNGDRNNQVAFAKGYWQAIDESVALVMNLKHRTAGVTRDEVGHAVVELLDKEIFVKLKTRDTDRVPRKKRKANL